MNISIGNDHAATAYKFEIVKLLKSKGINVKNYGTDLNESVDYPDFVHPVAKDIVSKKAQYGILLCGSGNGINMSANKHQAVRSALCWKKEIAELARLHNNANVLAMPARFISYEEAQEIVEIFLETKFEGGRHERRVNKITYP